MRLVFLLSFALGCAVCAAQTENSTDPQPTQPASTPAPITSVCYGDLGCFNNTFPFNNTYLRLPNPPELVGTKFLLFTRSTRDGPGQELNYTSSASVRTSSFDRSLPVKIIIHGFQQDETADWMHALKNALLDIGKFNVIITGWGKGAVPPDYLLAASNIRVVSRQVAMLIRLLVGNGSSLQKVHIIGHSLGAHTAGLVGSEFNGAIKRISGLDPADPSFENKDAQVRLDKSDAIFVDVLHTNGAPITQGGAGAMQEMGHVDFYPNGGDFQPGCPAGVTSNIAILLKGNLSAASDAASCSHNRACDLYTESIVSAKCFFTAFQCTGDYKDFLAGKCLSCNKAGDCSEMGYHADEHLARGKLYLVTSEAPKYCGISTAFTIETPSSSIAGNIVLLLTSREGTTTVDFVNNNGKFSGTTTKVLSTTLDSRSVLSMSLDYTKYGGALFGVGAGPDKWDLIKVTMTTSTTRASFCASGQVATGVQTQLYKCDSGINLVGR